MVIEKKTMVPEKTLEMEFFEPQNPLKLYFSVALRAVFSVFIFLALQNNF